jgi:hypothetical protein
VQAPERLAQHFKETVMSKSFAYAGQKDLKQEPARSKRPTTKTDTLLKALHRKTGASVPEMQKLTGWQAQSVRGFLSGTIKRKLGNSITTFVNDKRGRCYRIDTNGND